MRLLLGVMIALLAAPACRDAPDKAQPEFIRSKPKKDKKPKKEHFKDTVVVDTIRPDSIAVDSMTIDTTSGESDEVSIYRPASFRAVAPGDSSTYKVRYSLSSLATGDTVQIRFVRDSVAGKVKRVSITRNRFAKVDSATFVVDKIYGTAANYHSCVIKRRTTVLSSMCQDWTTNFPPKDTMSVDSSLALVKLDVKPDNFKVEVRKSQQLCAFLVFKDGKVAIRTKDRATTYCANQYTASFTLSQRSVTQRQQAVADIQCIKWEATGGTITAEVCPAAGATNL